MGRLQFLETWKMDPQSAAYVSALCLVAIQVGIGIVMKSSQTGGKYEFSTSGLVFISEFLKFLLSASLLLRHATKQHRMRRWEVGPGYAPLIPLPPSPRSSQEEFIEMKDIEEEKSSEDTLCENVDLDLEDIQPRMSLFRAFLVCLRGVSPETRFGFANLALLYALINNTIFVSYKLADPGTIALIRSGVIFITAMVMVTTLRTNISANQWIAIVIQLCGLITTQYRPELGSSYPYSTYAVLLSQVFVSSVAGVYNQCLLKSDTASLHAQNTVLYAFGIIINGIIHVVIRSVKSGEPSLFAGYTNLAAYLVILSNVFIGLAITAVYKYADAVIKCLASAVSTGILLFMSPAISGTTMTPLTVPGGLIVFISSWLYVNSPAKKTPASEGSLALNVDTRSQRHLFCISVLKIIEVPIATVATILIIAFLETVSFPDHFAKSEAAPSTPIIHSPFNTTMGFIKWNHFLPERISLLAKYEPFFHTVHYSMPLPDGSGGEFANLTHDSWQNPLVNYAIVAKTMQIILDGPSNSSESEITGMLFFHFDAWIDPLDFSDDDFSKMWIAYTQAYGGPTFICGTERSQFLDWPAVHKDKNWFYQIIDAQLELEKANTSYVFNPREYCMGWSDIYYFPRKYFADFIYLSAYFGAQNAFHEMTIPTIMHIIDQTRRKHDWSGLIDFIGHCYGGCCAPGANMNQLINHRCGHKLEYTGDQNVINAHYEKIDREAARLGTAFEEPDGKEDERFRNWTSFEKGLSASEKEGYEKVVVRPPPNKWRWDIPGLTFNQTGLEPPPAEQADGRDMEFNKEKRQDSRHEEDESLLAVLAERWERWLKRYT